MSESQHTPGKWEVEPNAGKGAWIGNDSGWAALALGNDDENARANALLIAAAPDLLAALKAVQPYFEGEHAYDHPHCKQLRDAIAKATGSTS